MQLNVTQFITPLSLCDRCNTETGSTRWWLSPYTGLPGESQAPSLPGINVRCNKEIGGTRWQMYQYTALPDRSEAPSLPGTNVRCNKQIGSTRWQTYQYAGLPGGAGGPSKPGGPTGPLSPENEMGKKMKQCVTKSSSIVPVQCFFQLTPLLFFFFFFFLFFFFIPKFTNFQDLFYFIFLLFFFFLQKTKTRYNRLLTYLALIHTS